MPFDQLSTRLENLEHALRNGGSADQIAVLQDLVPEFSNASGVVDWVHIEPIHQTAPARRRDRAARPATV